jgi:outer membrane protein OmpA-like peptidoglycan-associated protein
VVNSSGVAEKGLKKGDIIRIEKLYFDADQSDIKPEAEYALKNILTFLKTNPKVVVEVGGHTNNRAAEQFALELSTKRAKSVADWLISNGVSSNRVQYKGYGWTMPIASNESTEGRIKNQRVEVKILSTDG